MDCIRTPSGGAYGGYLFPRETKGTYLLICDPFTFPADGLLTHLNEQVPGAVVMGGMASAALRSRQSRLFLDGRVLSAGAVGVHLPNAEIHPLVAQGCRPIGDAYIITRADGNVIHELGARPPPPPPPPNAPPRPRPDHGTRGPGPPPRAVIAEERRRPAP